MSRELVTCSCPYCNSDVRTAGRNREPAANGATASNLTGVATTCPECDEAFELLYYETGEHTRQHSPLRR